MITSAGLGALRKAPGAFLKTGATGGLYPLYKAAQGASQISGFANRVAGHLPMSLARFGTNAVRAYRAHRAGPGSATYNRMTANIDRAHRLNDAASQGRRLARHDAGTAVTNFAARLTSGGLGTARRLEARHHDRGRVVDGLRRDRERLMTEHDNELQNNRHLRWDDRARRMRDAGRIRAGGGIARRRWLNDGQPEDER